MAWKSRSLVALAALTGLGAALTSCSVPFGVTPTPTPAPIQPLDPATGPATGQETATLPPARTAGSAETATRPADVVEGLEGRGYPSC